MTAPTETTSIRATLPRTGRPKDELLRELEAAKAHDIDFKHGRVAGMVYLAPDDVYQVQREAYMAYFSENALSAKAFPSLGRMESEIVEMAGSLMHSPDPAGSVTSGGSESIFMGVKIARERARALQPHITEPEIVMPFTAHAAFTKSAYLLGLKSIRVPVGPDYRVRIEAMRAAITDNTVLIVGSAPSYPFGMIDPIPELAALAVEHNISCHVDACVGGFFLPWLERLGRELPAWDFRSPGVTTISADLHKFGYTAKAASLILSRDQEVFEYQPYTFGDWPSGIYRTPNVTGTRPGGPIAAAWAVLNYLGEEGYLRLTRETVGFVERLWAGINATPGLRVRGEPVMPCFAYEPADPDLDIYAVADGLEARGWWVYRERQPKGIHLMLSWGHGAYVDRYLADLREVVEQVRREGRAGTAKAASYN